MMVEIGTRVQSTPAIAKNVQILGSITHLPAGERNLHVCTGSHGGVVVARAALKAGVRSLICHDAGVGLEEAGIGGLDILNNAGVPAASVDYLTARIGDAEDMIRRGEISFANATAQALGVVPGMPVNQALENLVAEVRCFPERAIGGKEVVFERCLLEPDVVTPTTPVWLLDSASSIRAEDAGTIVITGSHGGLPSGNAGNAIKARVLLAAFNDAGIGIDRAGVARLQVLDHDNIAAICVNALSARIGEGRSTYETGIISVANQAAIRLGARIAMSVRELVAMLAQKPTKPISN